MSDHHLDHKRLIVNDTSPSAAWKNYRFTESKDNSKLSALLLSNENCGSITQDSSIVIKNNRICFKYYESDKNDIKSVAESSNVQNTSNYTDEISDIEFEQSNDRTSKMIEKQNIDSDSKNSIFAGSNSNMKLNNSTTGYTQDNSNECKTYASDINGKYNKNAPKRGKKGVDSLLEKLESSSKKMVNSEKEESAITNLQINQRVTSRLKSLSPDCNKSRSPSSREDEVISPSLSNDDSNEAKQRKKRKLGKPIRLSKQFKSIKNDSKVNDSKSQIIFKSYTDDHSCNSLTSPIQIEKVDRIFVKKTEGLDKEKYLKKRQHKDINLKDTYEQRNQVNEMGKGECTQCEKLSVLDMSKYLLDTLKSTEHIKPRRSSECVFDVCKNNRKIRRRSCDDFKELIYESASTMSIPKYTTAFHEVESQLEKMFAGIIEIDKNVSKTSILGLNKSVDTFSKDKTQCFINKKFAESVLSTSNEKNKNQPKTLLKMRTKKKLPVTINKISNNKCINIKRNNKKQIVYQKSMKKNVLKKKKDNMNLNEIFHESTFNSATTKCKGPIIQIKGFKKIASCTQIINAHKEDDEEKNKEKRKISSNGIIGRSSKTNFQSNLDYRGYITSANMIRKTRIDWSHFTKVRNLKTNVIVAARYNYCQALLKTISQTRLQIHRLLSNYIKIATFNRLKKTRFMNNDFEALLSSFRGGFINNMLTEGKAPNTGMFNSTLSMRYDAQTADITWICVFCKRGPHFLVSEHSSTISTTLCNIQKFPETNRMTPTILSDLFGPYLIEKNWIEDPSKSIIEQETGIQSIEDNINISTLGHRLFEDKILSSYKRRKTKLLDNFSNLYMGMITLGDDDRRWEVWLHEQCIIWAAGVFITGGRICGLQEAVWDSAKSICDTCGLTGANIGCIKRGCKSVTHYCCALTSGWLLDTNNFLPNCNVHNNN